MHKRRSNIFITLDQNLIKMADLTKPFTLPEDWETFYSQQAKLARHPSLREFYQQGLVASPETPIADIDMVALDFETSGLNADQDHIVSIGLVPFDISRIYAGQSAEWIIDPGAPVSEESIVIHGITHSEIDDAPAFAPVLDQFLKHIAGKLVVVHYRYIEREFLRNTVSRLFKEPLIFPVADTLELEADMLNHQRSLFSRLFNHSRDSVRLPDTRVRYGLPPYQNHNAMTDALATAELFQAQLAYHFNPETPIKNLWR